MINCDLCNNEIFEIVLLSSETFSLVIGASCHICEDSLRLCAKCAANIISHQQVICSCCERDQKLETIN